MSETSCSIVVDERIGFDTSESDVMREAIEQVCSWGTLSDANLEHLTAIQHIILYEEGKALTIDETLSRILQFYLRFVPYRDR